MVPRTSLSTIIDGAPAVSQAQSGHPHQSQDVAGPIGHLEAGGTTVPLSVSADLSRSLSLTTVPADEMDIGGPPRGDGQSCRVHFPLGGVLLKICASPFWIMPDPNRSSGLFLSTEKCVESHTCSSGITSCFNRGRGRENMCSVGLSLHSEHGLLRGPYRAGTGAFGPAGIHPLTFLGGPGASAQPQDRSQPCLKWFFCQGSGCFSPQHRLSEEDPTSPEEDRADMGADILHQGCRVGSVV